MVLPTLLLLLLSAFLADAATSRSRWRISMSSSTSPSAILDIQGDVSDYYGKILSSSEDLKTNACTTSKAPPLYIRKAIGYSKHT